MDMKGEVDKGSEIVSMQGGIITAVQSLLSDESAHTTEAIFDRVRWEFGTEGSTAVAQAAQAAVAECFTGGRQCWTGWWGR